MSISTLQDMEELEQARKEVQNGDMDRPAKQSAFKVI